MHQTKNSSFSLESFSWAEGKFNEGYDILQNYEFQIPNNEFEFVVAEKFPPIRDILLTK